MKINKKKEKAKNEFTEIVKNSNYKMLSEYDGADKKVDLECPKEHKWSVTPSHFKKGFGCPVCYGTDMEQAKEDLIKRTRAEGYEVIGEYVNIMTKIDFKCPKGHIYQSRPNDFKNGYRCNVCGSNSFGEDVAKELLVNKKIKFVAEKTFKGLVGVNGGRLRFDIYIPSKRVAIEIQGEQHFEFDEFLTNNVMEHDELKRRFCKENNIKLYEINYFRKNLGINKAKEEVINTLNNILYTLSF